MKLVKRIFKFKKGQVWDGDEEIIEYIMGSLLECDKAGDFPRVKQKTYITIMVVKK